MHCRSEAAQLSNLAVLLDREADSLKAMARTLGAQDGRPADRGFGHAYVFSLNAKDGTPSDHQDDVESREAQIEVLHALFRVNLLLRVADSWGAVVD